jgi:hypothetical protein
MDIDRLLYDIDIQSLLLQNQSTKPYYKKRGAMVSKFDKERFRLASNRNRKNLPRNFWVLYLTIGVLLSTVTCPSYRVRKSTNSNNTEVIIQHDIFNIY